MDCSARAGSLTFVVVAVSTLVLTLCPGCVSGVRFHCGDLLAGLVQLLEQSHTDEPVTPTPQPRVPTIPYRQRLQVYYYKLMRRGNFGDEVGRHHLRRRACENYLRASDRGRLCMPTRVNKHIITWIGEPLLPCGSSLLSAPCGRHQPPSGHTQSTRSSVAAHCSLGGGATRQGHAACLPGTALAEVRMPRGHAPLSARLRRAPLCLRLHHRRVRRRRRRSAGYAGIEQRRVQRLFRSTDNPPPPLSARIPSGQTIPFVLGLQTVYR